MTGFYLMHRGWQENPVFAGDPFSKRDAWCWLIENAAFTTKRIGLPGKTIDINRGQLCHSMRFLAGAWKWELTKVLRFLARLQREEMIRYSGATGQTVITICKYDDYQLDGCSAATASTTATQQHRNSGATNKNEGNEGKKERDPEGSLLAAPFDEFYDAYPNKQKRPIAEQAFRAALKAGATQAEIMAGLQRHLAVWEAWPREERHWIPHPSSWLRAQAWRDDPTQRRGQVNGRNRKAGQRGHSMLGGFLAGLETAGADGQDGLGG